MESKGWKLVFQRLKTKIAEIDLVFEKDDKIALIEVKKLNEDWRVFQRWNPLQQMRFQANLVLFSRKFQNKEIKGFVAWVRDRKPVVFAEIG